MLSVTTSPMVNMPGGDTRLNVPVVFFSSASSHKRGKVAAIDDLNAVGRFAGREHLAAAGARAGQ